MAQGTARILTPERKIKLVTQRLKQVPVKFKKLIDDKVKHDAVGFIHTFQEGLRINAFGLRKLKEGTVESKKNDGKPKPNIPLFGWGDKEKNSYINMFYIKKIAGGYKAVPRSAKHYEANLPLKALFAVHEYGKTIRAGNATIRIPARPAGRRAYIKFYKGKDFKKEQKEFKSAIEDFIISGRVNVPKHLTARAKEYPKYAKNN